MSLTKRDLKNIDTIINTRLNTGIDDNLKKVKRLIVVGLDDNLKKVKRLIVVGLDDNLKKVKRLIVANSDLTSARTDKFEERMDHRFDENDRQHDKIIAKVDQLTKTETEDVAAAYEDIDLVKTRLKKAGL